MNKPFSSFNTMRILSILFMSSLLFSACKTSQDPIEAPIDSHISNAPNYRDTIVETATTLEVGKACAVYFMPTAAQWEALKLEVGEEDFYTITDDYSWYLAESRTYLEEKGIAIREITPKKVRFHYSDGKIFEVNPPDSINWNVILFDGKVKTAEGTTVDISTTYESLFR